jgi:phenylalanyl-tRNA synthetase beta chain
MTDPRLNKAFDIKAPSWTVEINLSMLEPFYTQMGTSHFEAIPKFPSIEYDAAFIVDSNLTSLILESDIRRIAGEILTNIYAFDVYEGSGLGEGKKSIAYRMSFMDKSKTLTISDVDPIIKNIVKELSKRYGALLRG